MPYSYFDSDNNSHKSFELPGAKPHYNPDRPGQVEHILRGLHSVLELQVQFDGTTRVTPFHASFPQFLFDKTRAGRYYIDKENINADIVRHTADLMRDYDKRMSSLG